MPSTAVANKLAAKRKISEKYTGFRRDAAKSAAREAAKVATARRIASKKK